MQPEELKELIQAGIQGADVTVVDLTGTRDHYRVEVVSPAFAGKALLAQHQMIYAAVGKHMNNAVHALQIRTSTPKE